MIPWLFRPVPTNYNFYIVNVYALAYMGGICEGDTYQTCTHYLAEQIYSAPHPPQQCVGVISELQVGEVSSQLRILLVRRSLGGVHHRGLSEVSNHLCKLLHSESESNAEYNDVMTNLVPAPPPPPPPPPPTHTHL